MKFTHDLKFNKAPDWKDQYIDYWHLKKLIYKNELTATQRLSVDLDRQRLLSPSLRRSESQRLPSTPEHRILRRADSEGPPRTPGSPSVRGESLTPLLEHSTAGVVPSGVRRTGSQQTHTSNLVPERVPSVRRS